jgi:ATP-dependent DNA ligase
MRLGSRHDQIYKPFPELCAEIVERVKGESAVLDGEIICLTVKALQTRNNSCRITSPV